MGTKEPVEKAGGNGQESATETDELSGDDAQEEYVGNGILDGSLGTSVNEVDIELFEGRSQWSAPMTTVGTNDENGQDEGEEEQTTIVDNLGEQKRFALEAGTASSSAVASGPRGTIIGREDHAGCFPGCVKIANVMPPCVGASSVSVSSAYSMSCLTKQKER